MFQQLSHCIFYRFDSFVQSEKILQAMSTRVGGVSEGEYRSLNLGFHVGDENDAVLINRQRFCQALSVPIDSLVTGQQVHEAEVAFVREGDRGRGAHSWEEGLPQTDALVTDVPGIGLMVLVADCAAVLLCDMKRKAIGIAHGSWRGIVGMIGRNTVRKMVEEFGCEPENIRVGMSPSIGPCCYQVGEEVISALQCTFPDTWRQFLIDKGDSSVHFNLWKALQQQLIDAGIRAEMIEMSGMCTVCHPDLFYSHRGEKGRTGRNGVIIALRG